MQITTPAIHIDKDQQKNPALILWQDHILSVNGQTYNYSDVNFEIGGSRDSLLFIHLNSDESLYLNLDRTLRAQLLGIEAQKVLFSRLFAIHQKNHRIEVSLLLGFILVVGSLIHFRGPIAGKLSTLIPPSFEKKIADQVFSTVQSEKFESHKKAETALIRLTQEIQDFDVKKYTIHLSSSKELNAYATVGGHLFINRGLIEALKKPEDLLGVVGHEMVHSRNRHVIKSLFQSADLFLLIQTLLGDITGIAAVLVDSGGPLLNLSYSRDLESEADLEAVQLMLDSHIEPLGLKSALATMEVEQEKLLRETPGGEQINKILDHSFLRSHPQSKDRGLAIQHQVDNLLQNSKYKDIEYNNLQAQWEDLQKALTEL